MKRLTAFLIFLMTVFLSYQSFSYQFYGYPYIQKIRDFTLTDQNGKKISFSDFKGKYLLVFFGYTYCPDVCPTSMLRIKETLDNLGKYKDKVHVLFISVDPERDTPELLKKFISFYDPEEKYITGLTGSPEEIKKVARQFRAYYEKVPLKDNPEVGYLVDHTAFIYLIDKKGIMRLIFRPANDDPKRIAQDIIHTMKYFGDAK
ncbi:protein SCO1/2 [Persephonella hydrogeniphila]|uniref:Protein SCO1/2 n=1 Tax=Persephonella hydrogeniphila TaxID=198703 RepID=A0A285NIC1_9AQUI|nr:SCO family protein [Persephonella hydrogeniphila]SNZ08653.1 protein SCO1/2 [Persephonella hydrogeniphila]